MHACVILAFKCNATLKRTGVHKYCERRWKAFESWSNCSPNVKYSIGICVHPVFCSCDCYGRCVQNFLQTLYTVQQKMKIKLQQHLKRKKKDLEMCWIINRNTERWNCTIYVYCTLLFSLCYILRLTSCMRKNNTVQKYSSVNDM